MKRRTSPLIRFVHTSLLTAVAAGAWAGLPVPTSQAVILVDPPLVTGTNAIDPPGEQTVDQTPANATSIATLTAMSNLGAIQDFTGWSIQGTTNYIVFTTDSQRADVMSTYSGLTGGSPGGTVTSTSLRTSPGASIGIDSGATRTGKLTLDFGSATFDGTSVTAFDSAALAPAAVGFTVCGLLNVTSNVTVTFYGTDDTTVLSTQVLNAASDPDAGDGATYGSDGYVGYAATGTGVYSGIGKVLIVANQVIAGNNGIGIDDLAYTSSGKQYYATVTGAGTKNGSSWANAFAAGSLNTTINTTMVPGDTLNLGSGNYGKTNLGASVGALTITSSGTAGMHKRLVGVDTGSGLPVFDSQNWVRTAPSSGQSQIFNFSGSSSYWELANLVLRDCQHAVNVSASSSSPHNGLAFTNVQIDHVRHGFYCTDGDNMTFTNCSIIEYTKHAYRLDGGCDNVSFTSCLADLSNGDVSWWDYSEPFPFGWTIGDSSANSGISFQGCIARNNRRNNQKNSDGTPLGYWNGDGYSMESNTVGTTTFTDCVSTNNEDGGYDIKPTAVFTNCVAVRCHRGFRCWDTAKTLNNCVATFTFSRSTSNPNGVEGGGAGVWVQNGTVTLDHFTYESNAGTAIDEDSSGSASLTNSILAFTGATGTFTSGSVTLGTGTVTYKPGAGTDPMFVNPTPTWDGLGDDMNSQTYGTTKGFYQAP